MKLTTEQIKSEIQQHESKIIELQEELKKSSYITGFERVDKGESFYFIASKSELIKAQEENFHCDDLSFDSANYGSEKRMSLLGKMNRLQRLMHRFSCENGGDRIDWDDEKQTKYSIFYENLSGIFKIDEAWVSQDINQTYFISEDAAEQALERFHPFMVKIIKEEQEVRDYYLELNSKEKLTSSHKFSVDRMFLIDNEKWKIIDIGEDETGTIYEIREMYEEGSEVLTFSESELEQIILRGSFDE